MNKRKLLNFSTATICLLLSFLELPLTARSIKVAFRSEALALDPHLVSDSASMRYLENMSCGLLRYAKDFGKVELDLASNYEISKDSKTYRFHLRKKAYFHNETMIDAQHVVDSWKRILKYKSNAFEMIDTIRAKGSSIVEFRLKKSYSPFLIKLAHPMNAIIDPVVYDQPSKLTQGFCGAYRLKEWKKNSYLNLEAFSLFYRKISTKTIQLLTIEDEKSRILALKNGRLDIVYSPSVKMLDELSKVAKLNIHQSNGSFWEYLGLQIEHPILKNKNVRKAIALAINRSQLSRLVKFGYASELNSGPIPENHWAYLDQNYFVSTKIEQARQLLIEAGYEKGFALEILVGSDFRDQVDAAIIIKQQLKPLNIKVKINALESGHFFSLLNQKNFEACIVGWVGFIDPDEWFSPIFHSKGQWNQLSYKNSHLDKLIETAKTLDLRSKRIPLYKKIQQILIEDSPMIFLYNNPEIAITRREVEGFWVHPSGVSYALSSTQISE